MDEKIVAEFKTLGDKTENNFFVNQNDNVITITGWKRIDLRDIGDICALTHKTAKLTWNRQQNTATIELYPTSVVVPQIHIDPEKSGLIDFALQIDAIFKCPVDTTKLNHAAAIVSIPITPMSVWVDQCTALIRLRHVFAILATDHDLHILYNADKDIISAKEHNSHKYNGRQFRLSRKERRDKLTKIMKARPRQLVSHFQ